MLDPKTILRVIATTTLYFGLGGSTPTDRFNLAASANSGACPAMRNDALKAEVLRTPSRRLQRSMWI